MFSFSSKDENGFSLLNYADGEIAIYQNEYSDTITRAFELLDELFARFVDLSQEHGFQFTVAIIPTTSTTMRRIEFLIPPHHKRALEKNYFAMQDTFDFDKPYEIVLDICKKRAIPCIDIRNEIRSVGLEAFNPQDDHLSPIGHEVMAKALANRFDTSVATFK